MDTVVVFIQSIPVVCYRWLLLAAMAFALFMAVIPGKADPTYFINDKVKHALTFVVLFALMDQAFPTDLMPFWKPLTLFGFGILIEICQEMTRYRKFSIGDIVANAVGIAGYWLFTMASA